MFNQNQIQQILDASVAEGRYEITSKTLDIDGMAITIDYWPIYKGKRGRVSPELVKKVQDFILNLQGKIIASLKGKQKVEVKKNGVKKITTYTVLLVLGALLIALFGMNFHNMGLLTEINAFYRMCFAFILSMAIPMAALLKTNHKWVPCIVLPMEFLFMCIIPELQLCIDTKTLFVGINPNMLLNGIKVIGILTYGSILMYDAVQVINFFFGKGVIDIAQYHEDCFKEILID